MLDQMPSFSRKLTSVIEKVSTLIAERTDLSPQRLTELLDKGRAEVSNTITGGFAEVFQSFSSFISFVFILPIFTFLIVLYRHSITLFVSTLGNSNSTAKKTWTETLADIKKVVLKYSSGLLIVIIILATLNTLGLLILGIPFAFILGVSSAVLTIVPYIGNFLGGSLAVLVAFVMKDDPMYALYVFLLYMGVQILEGNLITPKIMGKQMGVNPLVVIIALLAGGFIWGVVGMIISVPIVAVIKVLMERKEELLPLVELMKEDD
jgi:predicted PurR-regulated permease PerM